MSCVYTTVLSTRFPPALEICLCQLFPFLSRLHIYRVLSPILFILPCFCLLVHFDNKMPLRIPFGCSLLFMPIGFHLTVLFQDLCIFSGESSCLWLWFLKALGMYVTVSHWFYSQFSGLKFDSCSIPGSHDIISMVFWNYTQWSCSFPLRLYWRSLSFLSGSMVLSVFYMSFVIYSQWGLFFIHLCNYTFYLPVQGVTIKLFWIWGEAWSVEDFFWNACSNCFLP